MYGASKALPATCILFFFAASKSSFKTRIPSSDNCTMYNPLKLPQHNHFLPSSSKKQGSMELRTSISFEVNNNPLPLRDLSSLNGPSGDVEYAVPSAASAGLPIADIA